MYDDTPEGITHKGDIQPNNHQVIPNTELT